MAGNLYDEPSTLSATCAGRHLALSTNSIDKIAGLGGLDALQILSLGRNLIRKIEGLEPVGATLEQLWLSYNQLERLVSLKTIWWHLQHALTPRATSCHTFGTPWPGRTAVLTLAEAHRISVALFRRPAVRAVKSWTFCLMHASKRPAEPCCQHWTCRCPHEAHGCSADWT